MFTGLVQAIGVVRAIEPRGAGARLVIDAHAWSHRAGEGESIAVSGVCLTAVASAGPESLSEGILAFDCIAETLARSTLGDLRAGHRVNLEHSVRADTLMGGHMVQGHVDGVARVARVKEGDGDWWVDFALPPVGSASDLGDLAQYIIPKGSVTLAGVSLTVASVDVASRRFGVGLIPTTLEATTLGALREGDAVNLETDIISRTIVHWLTNYRGDSAGKGEGHPGGSPLRWHGSPEPC